MKCEFCGKERLPIIIELKNKTFNVGHHPCNCKEATERTHELERLAKIAEEKEKERLINRLIEISGVPKRYMNAKLYNEEIYEKALESGLYIHGDVGTGKTHIASAIAIRAAQNNKRILFLKAYNLSNFDLDDVTIPDLLIIDDLGADNVSEWANSRMRAVIDDRYGSMKPLIVTSNYSKAQLAKKLHKENDYTALAIVSRLNEMTESYEVKGKDRRK